MGTVRRRLAAHAWDGVTAQEYGGEVAGVEKHELVEGPDYRLRYFHVPPGGRTARERHPHDHGVVIERGRARVTLGEQTLELGPGDVVYVAGDELHCFEALGEEPLGFFCVTGPRR